MIEVRPFDAVDYLDSEEMISEYITAAMEDPNPDVLLKALSDVARARGMAALAERTGLAGKVSTKRCGPVRSRVMKPSPKSWRALM